MQKGQDLGIMLNLALTEGPSSVNVSMCCSE